MTKSFLQKELEAMQNAKRVNRERVAFLVLENPELVPFLLDFTFDVNNKLSIKAAWALEIVCEKKLDELVPYLNRFTSNLYYVTFDSAVRPLAKICNFLAIAYNSKKNSLAKSALSKKHINAIVEVGFDWMLSDQKVAVKAYTMNALFLLGKNYDWVHEELKLLLEKNIAEESAAYKARARITLELINKK